MNTTFFFIIEGKTLELQSLFLAHSFRAHHGPDVPCIAYVPEAYLSSLDPLITEYMAAQDIEIRPLHVSPGMWNDVYRHGNKILAAAQPRACDYSIFLDTDMCCVANVVPDYQPSEARVFAVPEDRATWGSRSKDWTMAYRYFGMTPPEDRVQLVRGGRRWFYPYFNAGFVGFPERHPQTGERFGELWLQTAVALDFGAQVPEKRPWLDQVSLPITMYRFGFDYAVLDEAYNFSTKARLHVDADQPLRIAHYHRSADFMKWTGPAKAFEAFAADLRRYPRGRPLIQDPELFRSALVRKRVGGSQELIPDLPVEA